MVLRLFCTFAFMKVLQISAVRAILVLVIGFLLVKYREETMTWMTITIGILFFLSGLFSCAVYYIEKERVKKQTSESDENNDAVKGPSFPVAGVGSIILGIILAVMPNTFITWVVYILAALLILGAVNQFMGLASSRQYSQVPIFYWFFKLRNCHIFQCIYTTSCLFHFICHKLTSLFYFRQFKQIFHYLI